MLCPFFYILCGIFLIKYDGESVSYPKPTSSTTAIPCRIPGALQRRRRFRVVFQTHFKYDGNPVSYSKYVYQLKNGTCSRISRLNNYLNKSSLIICISLAYIESLISATVSSITLYASLASSTFPVSNRLSGYTRLLTANRILSSGCCA